MRSPTCSSSARCRCVALVGLVSLLYATLAAPLVDPHALAARRLANDGSHLLSTGALLGLWILTALVYPLVARRINRFVDRVLLRRTDYRAFRTELAKTLAAARDVPAALDVTCSLLRGALGATGAEWVESHAARSPGDATIELDAAADGRAHRRIDGHFARFRDPDLGADWRTDAPVRRLRVDRRRGLTRRPPDRRDPARGRPSPREQREQRDAAVGRRGGAAGATRAARIRTFSSTH